MKILLTIVCFALLIMTGCQVSFLKKTPRTVPPEALEQIHTYLDCAEQSKFAPDSSSAEAYYLRALQALDSLSLIYTDDSTLVNLLDIVNTDYDDYLHEMMTLNADTLTEAQVMMELSEIFDAAPDSSDLTGDTLTTLRIPIVLNQKVERAIKYFTSKRGRKIFRRWLRRAGRYEKMVKRILHEENAPEELFYLAMIESGLRPTVRSYARAVGLWQFIAGTGRYYGLRQSWWFDERRDPVKASRAAGRHLLDLHERFGDWYLAIAGYNYSPRKIEKRMARYKVDEFWDLPRLPRQTRNYVPTYLAAVAIASNLEKYGFDDIQPEAPIEFDTVTVKQSIDLTVIAKAVGSNYKEIKALNPAILRWCTPPDVDKWQLYLPSGTRDLFLSKYDSLPKSEKRNWVRHRIRSGEALSTIARRYGVSVSEVKKFNKLRSNLIRAGRTLMIPVPVEKPGKKKVASAVSQVKKRRKKSRPKPKVVQNVPGREKQIYTVKKGDSLWEVARKFNVSVKQVRAWNGLGYSRLIKPGQKLNIWQLPEGAAEKTPLLAKTELPGNSSKKAAIKTPEGKNAFTYTVRPGDTLWDIAQAHRVSIRDLKKWNRKRSNKIKPGEVLTILASE